MTPLQVMDVAVDFKRADNKDTRAATAMAEVPPARF
jgi:hypothetical protein